MCRLHNTPRKQLLLLIVVFYRLAIAETAASNFSIAIDTSSSVMINGGTNLTTLGPIYCSVKDDAFVLNVEK